THDILQSDIALARSLLTEGHSDLDVMNALNRRGVGPSNAQQLIVDLRAGKEVRPVEIPLGVRLKPPPVATASATSRRRSHRNIPNYRPAGIAVLLLAILTCCWLMFRSPARSARAGGPAASALSGL